MRIFDYIKARWGDVDTWLPGDESEICDIRLASMWTAIAKITGTNAESPWTLEVHSPRALPAVLHLDGRRHLVWDAGLSTFLTNLAFPLRYPDPQPGPVVEAILRRTIAVRFLLAGQVTEAASHVHYADRLLKETPIDRFHQDRADIESRFEVWLMTEMQERFVLAHELVHYLRSVDPEAFERCSSEITKTAKDLFRCTEPAGSVLSRRLYYSDHSSLWARELDPYAWYLRIRQRTSKRPTRKSWVSRVRETTTALSSSSSLNEEIICDLIASLAVGLDAHLRQKGWSAMMGVSCCRLALANLATIMGIDSWISGNQESVSVVQPEILVRGRCLDVLLPFMLPKILKQHGGNCSLRREDIQEVMLLVEMMNEEALTPAFAAIDHLPEPPEGPVLTYEETLLLAGFIYFPPRAS